MWDCPTLTKSWAYKGRMGQQAMPSPTFSPLARSDVQIATSGSRAKSRHIRNGI